jgi:hypothetical protein
MIFVFWCFVIKLAVKTITVKFKLSTRSFGCLIETNPDNVSHNNN